MQKRMLAMAIAAILVCGGIIAVAQEGVAQTPAATTGTAGSSALAGMALSESDIKHDIAGAGFQEVENLRFEDGVWKAKARGGNDKWTTIRVGPITGKVYEADAPSRLNKSEIKAKLTAQGFQNIDDVKFDDGLWKAEARNPDDKKVDLLVDPDDGSVVAMKQD